MVWYPAVVAESATMMPWEGFFHPDARTAADSGFARLIGDHARDVATEELRGDPDDTTVTAAALTGALRQVPTGVVRDAPWADGRFPVVIHHAGAGSSYEDDALYAARLASAGYIVISGAFQGASFASLEPDHDTLSRGDIAFLIRHAATEPHADIDRLALSGHSAGAQTVLSWSADHPGVARTVLSFDTTQDYWAADDPTWSFARDLLAARDTLAGAVLVVAKPDALFALWDRLDALNRHLLGVPGLEHNDFITQGILRRLLHDRLTDTVPSDTTRAAIAGYHVVVEAAVAHLDAVLGGEATPWQRFASGEAVPAGGVLYEIPAGGAARAAGPVARNARQVAAIAAEHGADSALALVAATPAGSAVRTRQYGASWVYRLATDGEIAEARRVALRYDSEFGQQVRSTLAFHCTILELIGKVDPAAACRTRLAAIEADGRLP